MALKQVLEIADLVDRPDADAETFRQLFASRGMQGAEVVKSLEPGLARFYDRSEFARMVRLYSPMKHSQSLGRAAARRPRKVGRK
ncbi:MAG: hypothetical protein ABSH28_06005 [Acidobacteriota bacterium]|jgi:hypothetical protein